MRKYNSTDAPLFLRAGIDRNDVKVLDNQKDFDNFKTTVGISFNGYGFAQNETILIPDLPVVATKEGEKAMKIISIPSYEGADENHRTYLLEVERERDGAKSKSWLNRMISVKKWLPSSTATTSASATSVAVRLYPRVRPKFNATSSAQTVLLFSTTRVTAFSTLPAPSPL